MFSIKHGVLMMIEVVLGVNNLSFRGLPPRGRGAWHCVGGPEVWQGTFVTVLLNSVYQSVEWR